MKTKAIIIVSIIFCLLAGSFIFNFKFSQAEGEKSEDWQTRIERKIDKILANQDTIFIRLNDLDRLVRTRKVD
jgi:hypothetical protein